MSPMISYKQLSDCEELALYERATSLMVQYQSVLSSFLEVLKHQLKTAKIS